MGDRRCLPQGRATPRRHQLRNGFELEGSAIVYVLLASVFMDAVYKIRMLRRGRRRRKGEQIRERIDDKPANKCLGSVSCSKRSWQFSCTMRTSTCRARSVWVPCRSDASSHT